MSMAVSISGFSGVAEEHNFQTISPVTSRPPVLLVVVEPARPGVVSHVNRLPGRSVRSLLPTPLLPTPADVSLSARAGSQGCSIGADLDQEGQRA